MRTFGIFRTGHMFYPDRRALIACICTVILAIISGIVLCITVQINPYMQNYASEYLFFVYNFNNFSLLLPHFLCELVYGYAFFLIAYCTRFRLAALPLLFIKAMISGVYAVLIISVSAFGGVMAAVFVFIPTSLVTLALNVFLIECVRFFNKKFAPALPAVLALLSMLAECLFLNVIFRVLIAVT